MGRRPPPKQIQVLENSAAERGIGIDLIVSSPEGVSELSFVGA